MSRDYISAGCVPHPLMHVWEATPNVYHVIAPENLFHVCLRCARVCGMVATMLSLCPRCDAARILAPWAWPRTSRRICDMPTTAREEKAAAVAAMVAASAVPKPRGKAPKAYPLWDTQRGVWTNEAGDTQPSKKRAVDDAAAAAAAASGSTSTTAPPESPMDGTGHSNVRRRVYGVEARACKASCAIHGEMSCL